jgi:hypothetical protein
VAGLKKEHVRVINQNRPAEKASFPIGSFSVPGFLSLQPSKPVFRHPYDFNHFSLLFQLDCPSSYFLLDMPWMVEKAAGIRPAGFVCRLCLFLCISPGNFFQEHPVPATVKLFYLADFRMAGLNIALSALDQKQQGRLGKNCILDAYNLTGTAFVRINPCFLDAYQKPEFEF